MAFAVESTWKAYRRHPNNEADSSHKLQILTRDFLEDLNDLARAGEKLPGLESTMDSAKVPGFALASLAFLSQFRPNFALYLYVAFILRWENVTHLSLRSALNTMGTRGTPE